MEVIHTDSCWKKNILQLNLKCYVIIFFSTLLNTTRVWQNNATSYCILTIQLKMICIPYSQCFVHSSILVSLIMWAEHVNAVKTRKSQWEYRQRVAVRGADTSLLPARVHVCFPSTTNPPQLRLHTFVNTSFFSSFSFVLPGRLSCSLRISLNCISTRHLSFPAVIWSFSDLISLSARGLLSCCNLARLQKLNIARGKNIWCWF